MRLVRLLLLGIPVLITVACLQANVVSVHGDQILQDGKPVNLIGLRCSNALISDVTTLDLIRALDLYQSYGLNTVSVFVMGSRFGDVKGYLPDGSMDPVYRKRFERILKETDERGMILIVGCLYWSTSLAKEELMHWMQADADKAIAGTAQWLGDLGYRHIILDPDNEGMAGREMEWNTDSMIRAAKTANPKLVVANNTRQTAPSADLNMHFGPKEAGKPWLDSECTPKDAPVSNYWGKFSKESHQADPAFYNYSRIGRYTEEMKRSQFALTREYIDNYNGILLASTWLQCSPKQRVFGPFVDPGGRSDLGSGSDLSAQWNQRIDRLHPDAGILWWLEFIKENYPANSLLHP
ncbi:MAG: hypothetical protein AB3N63_00460 [Puniceicoccaceae bacterium]